MKNLVWIMLGGVATGTLIGILLNLGYAAVAAGLGVSVLIATVGFVHWRLSRAQAKILKIARSLQNLPREVQVVSNQLEMLQKTVSQLAERNEESVKRIRNDFKNQSRDTNSMIDRNHRARLTESAQNARLLGAIEKQRDLLGTLIINSEFQSKAWGNQI